MKNENEKVFHFSLFFLAHTVFISAHCDRHLLYIHFDRALSCFDNGQLEPRMWFFVVDVAAVWKAVKRS